MSALIDDTPSIDNQTKLSKNNMDPPNAPHRNERHERRHASSSRNSQQDALRRLTSHRAAASIVPSASARSNGDGRVSNALEAARGGEVRV